MKYCEKCGKQISDEAIFCERCGYKAAVYENAENTKQTNAGEVCENAHVEEAKQVLTCEKCGKQISDGDNFCEGCGAKVAVYESVDNVKQTDSNEVCENAHTEEATQVFVCQSCGYEHSVLPLFCEKCGVRMRREDYFKDSSGNVHA